MLALEVFLAELDIVVVHRKAVLYDKIRKLCVSFADEARERFNGGGDSVLYFQGVVLVETALAGLNGVDEVVLDARELIIGYLSPEDVDLSVLYNRALARAEHLNALCSGIRTLVELTRQELDREHSLVCGSFGQVVEHLVNRRLGEHRRDSCLEILFGQLLAVVAVDNAYILDRSDAESHVQVSEDCAPVNCELRLLFHINSVNHRFSSNVLLVRRKNRVAALNCKIYNYIILLNEYKINTPGC